MKTSFQQDGVRRRRQHFYRRVQAQHVYNKNGAKTGWFLNEKNELNNKSNRREKTNLVASGHANRNCKRNMKQQNVLIPPAPPHPKAGFVRVLATAQQSTGVLKFGQRTLEWHLGGATVLCKAWGDHIVCDLPPNSTAPALLTLLRSNRFTTAR